MSFGNYTLTDLEYADDTTLFSNTVENLRDPITIFDAEAKKLWLSINYAELMHVEDGPDPPPLICSSISVKFIDYFIYLG